MLSFLFYCNTYYVGKILTCLSFLPKKEFFLRDKLGNLLANVTFKLNYSGVDKIFKNELNKMSNAVEKKLACILWKQKRGILKKQ